MNRILLDTCVFLWWQADAERLTDDVRRAIQDADEVFVSAASAWEIAIKLGMGKLEIPEPFDRMLVAQARLENLLLATADEKLRPYAVPCLWV